MFGVDNFNYGQIFNAPITDYTDPDDEKYFCITHPDFAEGNDATALHSVSGRIFWLNGDNNIIDIDGELINQKLDIMATQGVLTSSSLNSFLLARLTQLGFVKDCVKAKQEQNVEGSDSGGDSGGDSPKCSDTNQVANDDGTCGDCEGGYVEDIDSDSDTYGECIEAVDNTLLYAGIGGAALLLLIVALK